MLHRHWIPNPAQGAVLGKADDEWFIGVPDGTRRYANPTAALIWHLCDGDRSLGEVAGALHEAFPETGHDIDLGLVDVVRSLLQDGLLTLTAPADGTDGPDAAAAGDPELCILFLHHRPDPVTQRHLDLLTWFNPEARVVPLAINASALLPGPPANADISGLDCPWNVEDFWQMCDVAYYQWFLHRPFSARRYLLMEWDCLCTMPIREAYREVWDAEVAAHTVLRPERLDYWCW